ncbi:MAG: alcohol dehydrogenase catalytic domain-containing protein [Propionicimonas sp.]|nr:alcohol dehydrogenase catalytic domain-containing protein [Propionicimonas sp.]
MEVITCGICGGDPKFPGYLKAGTILGHEFLGRVVTLGAGVTDFTIGERVVGLPAQACGTCVWCLTGEQVQCAQFKMVGQDVTGGYAEYLVVDAQSMCHVPGEVSDRQAGLMEPLSIGAKVFEECRVAMGDKLLIIGAGPIGLAVLIWAVAGGVDTIVVSDVKPARRELALKLGATDVLDPAATSLEDYFDNTYGSRPEVICECAGFPGILDQAIKLAPLRGRVVSAGLHFGEETITQLIPHVKNPTLVWASWYAKRHWRHALTMTAQGRIDPTPMLTDVIALEDVPATFEALGKPNDFGKILIDPHQAPAR